MAIIPGIYASQISGHLITSNFFLISQVTPSSGGTVTFSSIPSTYKSLQIRYSVITAAGNTIGVRFNGDSTGNSYAIHTLYGSSSSAGASGVASSGNPGIINVMGFGPGTVATYPNVGIVDVVDYASTSKYKTVKSIGGGDKNATGGDIELDSGVWLFTTAITSLSVVASGNFSSGSTISLYGVS